MPASSSPAVRLGDLLPLVLEEIWNTPPTVYVPLPKYQRLEDSFVYLWTTNTATSSSMCEKNWETSIRLWEEAGITEADLGGFIDYIATREDLPASAHWRYLCGCCWRTIRARRGEVRA